MNSSANRNQVLVACFLVLAAVCGLPASASSASRIVGGTKPSSELWNSTLWATVPIVQLGARDEYNGHHCGGVLIDDNHVLTAAHCVAHSEPLKYRDAATSLAVKPGYSGLWESGLDHDALIPVTAIFVHPNFNPKTMRWDAAILRLGRPTDVVPVPLLTSEESTTIELGIRSRYGIIAGWGDTDPIDPDIGCCFPSELYSATVPVHSNSTCYGNLSSSLAWRFDTEHQLCAGELGTSYWPGRDSCQGDSGGPLFVTGATWVRLAGLTSLGVGCGQGNYGIYARASSLQPWISSIPGTTPGDTRDGTLGPDGMGAPGVRARPAGFDSFEVNVTAPTAGPRPLAYTVWRRFGSRANAVDAYIGRFTEQDFLVYTNSTRTFTLDQYFIRAAGPSGEGPSTRVYAGPRVDWFPPPRPRIRHSVSGDKVLVRWSAVFDNQSGTYMYEIQRRVGSRWQRPGKLSNDVNNFVFAQRELTAVRVRTIDNAGNRSPWSMTRIG